MKASSQMPVLVILVLSVTSCVTVAWKPQPVHLFEVHVRVPDGGVDDFEENNYRLLARAIGSYSEAMNVTYETYPGLFRAFLTNKQARKLSQLPGVLGVKRRDDLMPSDGN